jgi:hypothetical protein
MNKITFITGIATTTVVGVMYRCFKGGLHQIMPYVEYIDGSVHTDPNLVTLYRWFCKPHMIKSVDLYNISGIFDSGKYLPDGFSKHINMESLIIHNFTTIPTLSNCNKLIQLAIHDCGNIIKLHDENMLEEMAVISTKRSDTPLILIGNFRRMKRLQTTYRTIDRKQALNLDNDAVRFMENQ